MEQPQTFTLPATLPDGCRILDVAPDGVLLELPNGARFGYAHRATTGGSYTAKVMVGCGYYDQTKETVGYPHAIEHMLFQGSDRFPAAVGAGSVSEYFRRFKQTPNASTGTITHLIYDNGSGRDTGTIALLEEELCDGIVPFVENALSLHFNPTQWAVEQEYILKEIREKMKVMAERPALKVINDEFDNACLPHPGRVAGLGGLGTLEQVSAITPEGLRDWWQQFYTAERFIVAVCGPQFPAELVEQLAKTFSTAPCGQAPYRAPMLEQCTPEKTITGADSNRAIIVIPLAAEITEVDAGITTLPQRGILQEIASNYWYRKTMDDKIGYGAGVYYAMQPEFSQVTINFPYTDKSVGMAAFGGFVSMLQDIATGQADGLIAERLAAVEEGKRRYDHVSLAADIVAATARGMRCGNRLVTQSRYEGLRDQATVENVREEAAALLAKQDFALLCMATNDANVITKKDLLEIWGAATPTRPTAENMPVMRRWEKAQLETGMSDEIVWC